MIKLIRHIIFQIVAYKRFLTTPVKLSEANKVMAAAEGRATWRQTSSRCFVQEDARITPKLSCCTSSSSNLESNDRPGDAVNRSDDPIPGCVPYDRDFSNPDLLPGTKWWLHLHPNCGHHKDFTHEQLNSLEAELEALGSEYVNQTAKFSGENQRIESDGTLANPKSNAGSFVDQPWKVSATCMENDLDARIPELGDVISYDLPKKPHKKDVEDIWYADNHLMDLDPFNCFLSEQPEKLCSDLESHWIGAENTDVWWRTADKDDLVSLVSHKSLEHIENCDLPQPQNKHFGRGPSTYPQSFDHNKTLVSSLDQIAEKGISNLADYSRGSPTSVSMDKRKCTLGDVGCSPLGSDRPISGNNGCSSTNMDKAETEHIPDNNLSKAQLLEALCHSQTRAREAEKAAQQAYDEKEHIIKLFFRQASHLFAYKQWLQILQLETLCLQLRNKDQPITTCFPAFIPWIPYKGRQLRKSRCKAANRGIGPSRYKISKCAVAFAVGLSLASASLLLGWTMGWWFPAL